MRLSALELMTLLNIPGVGTAKVRKIKKMIDHSAFDDFESAIASVLTSEQLQKMTEARARAEKEYKELQDLGTDVLAIGDTRYPISLAEKLGDLAPLLLLCRGNVSILKFPSVGFCGSRSASDKGIAAARDSATSLAHAKVNVVSGYAAGVDMTAHEAALDAGGTTTIVLAEGLLRFRIKKNIKHVWDETRTLVISEFGAKGAWSVGNAMQRNKTICALSQALILIEARERSGSIEAGKECLKLHMPLFAAVYEGSPESSKGNEAVLEIGAKRLMKSRATNLPNIRPVLEVVLNQENQSAFAQVHSG